MEALDGNAIAGELFEFFGTDMTTAIYACTHCGARGQIAELRVYLRAPGTVVRCRACGNVVMVLVASHGNTRVHINGFELVDQPGYGAD
jgi:DNA-directed RNA polymerase subunit RPC12/RpoP